MNQQTTKQSLQATKKTPQWRPYYRIPGMEVSEDGQVRRHYTKNINALLPSRPPKWLKPQTDKNGNSIVRTKSHGDLRIDHLVESCFHGTVGSNQRVFHKDGNKKNCHKDNLRKISIKDYNKLFRSGSDWKECYSEEDEVEVNVKTKEIKQHGQVLPVHDESYDSDTDRHVKVAPFVILQIKNRYGKIETIRPKVDELINAV